MHKLWQREHDIARNKLSETRIRTLSKPGVYSDGDGLYLRVRSGGSKQWIFIHKRGGIRTENRSGSRWVEPDAALLLFS
ncbi:Arm DNA-binding domain-containing protein [Brucella pseudogrignonensis]|uniref:Arm DNA-binding domain-containing protein n=1 Tax=Brucella pseudogrignonensis TaxID=419475 RepID=UPI002E25A26D